MLPPFLLLLLNFLFFFERSLPPFPHCSCCGSSGVRECSSLQLITARLHVLSFFFLLFIINGPRQA